MCISFYYLKNNLYLYPVFILTDNRTDLHDCSRVIIRLIFQVVTPHGVNNKNQMNSIMLAVNGLSSSHSQPRPHDLSYVVTKTGHEFRQNF